MVEEQAGGRIHVSLTLNNLIDVQRRVLACGRHACVLAPRELQEAIAAELKAMCAHYEQPFDAARPMRAAETPASYSQGHVVSSPLV